MSLLALSLRSVLRGRRVVAVALLPLVVAAIALALASSSSASDRSSAYATLTGGLLLPLVVPLVALVLGVNAFGDERDERTLGLLLATTIPRSRLALTKYVAAAAVTWVACLPAVAGCLALASTTAVPTVEAAWSLLAASLLAALAYVALFVLLSLLLRRAVLVGLAYLVLWEGLLAGLAVAFRNLSVGAHVNRVAAAPFDRSPFAVADAPLLTSAAVLVVLVLAAVAASGRRLTRVQV